MSIGELKYEVSIVFINSRILLLYFLIDILPFVATQIKLESIGLSDISQAQKDKCGILPLICGLSNSQTHKTRTEL